jgi:hypothetical protein
MRAATVGRHGAVCGRFCGERDYRVTVVLAVPGRNVAQEDVDFAGIVDRGDSLLVVPSGVRELRVRFSRTEHHAAEAAAAIHVNAERRLRDVSLEIEATSFDAAARNAYDLVMPMLSRWSFLHDVAIGTSGTLIEEIATGTRRLEAMVVGAVKAFSDDASISTPEHRMLLASYREGLSSTEPLWQALSLYKVAEGVWALRNQRIQGHRAAGLAINQPSERVPGDVSNLGHPAGNEPSPNRSDRTPERSDRPSRARLRSAGSRPV